MTIGAILVGIGLLLVFVEFFVPGGIVGIAGAVILVAGLVIFCMASPWVWLSVVVVIVSVFLLGLLIWLALWRIRSGKSDSGIYLKADQAGYKASKFALEYLGKEGKVVADLKPAGHILVEGRRLQAVSKMGYLQAGTRILVVGGAGAHLVVKAVTESTS